MVEANLEVTKGNPFSREVSQTPLWYISRKTPGDKKSSGSKPGIKEIAVRPNGSWSGLKRLRHIILAKVRRHEPMMPPVSSSGVRRKEYQSGVCEASGENGFPFVTLRFVSTAGEISFRRRPLAAALQRLRRLHPDVHGAVTYDRRAHLTPFHQQRHALQRA